MNIIKNPYKYLSEAILDRILIVPKTKVNKKIKREVMISDA